MCCSPSRAGVNYRLNRGLAWLCSLDFAPRRYRFLFRTQSRLTVDQIGAIRSHDDKDRLSPSIAAEAVWMQGDETRKLVLEGGREQLRG